MNKHLMLPDIEIKHRQLLDEHGAYLSSWLDQALMRVEAGDVAASMCLQGALIELTLHGELKTDWIGVFDEYLSLEGRPLAYSERFGQRLHMFASQAIQPTIHATHARWWIEQAQSGTPGDYVDGLESKTKGGWIFDHDVSPTVERHRMKSELTMSMAQAVEILDAANALAGKSESLVSTMSDLPPTGYLSAEYFRLRFLETLDSVQHMPVDTRKALDACALSLGFCDFAVATKVDAYMGTAKRVARDVAVASPIAACQLDYLLRVVDDDDAVAKLRGLVADYAKHLRANPLDIPAFQMRDIPISFGADVTPIEVLCAASLVERLGDGL